ncbi:hypothetical protein [Erythrobacter sp. R86502]|uniref:hypothetical protein n=1 Tax=Erythrobacter sp. R86502 TaxID=3093846 RepID=UPI0036D20F9E
MHIVMWPGYPHDPISYARLLADHASRLQFEARKALAKGDLTRADALIRDAEILALDVRDLVDSIEVHDADRLLHCAAKTGCKPSDDTSRRYRFAPPSQRRRIAVGSILAMSFALAEC